MIYFFDVATYTNRYGSVNESSNRQNNDWAAHGQPAQHRRTSSHEIDPLLQNQANSATTPRHQRKRSRDYAMQQPPKQWKIEEAINAVGQEWELHSSVQGQLLLGTGLLFLVDSMEVAILNHLAQAAKELQIQHQGDDDLPSYYYNYDWIAVAGVGGAVVGALLLGTLADLLGRRPICILVSCLITVFGLVTALFCTTYQDNYPELYEGLLVSRFLVGVGLGAISVPYDLLAEWLPNSSYANANNNINSSTPTTSRSLLSRLFTWPTQRGPILLLVELFWSLGTLLIHILMETESFFSPTKGQLSGMELVWCTIPSILATLLFCGVSQNRVIPESPRWLLSQGRQEDALFVLRQAAQENGLSASELFPPHVILLSHEAPVISTDNTFGNPYPNQPTDVPQQPQDPRSKFETPQLSNNANNQALPDNDHVLRYNVATSSTRSTQSSTSWMNICHLFSFQWLKLSSALLATYFGQAFCYRGTVSLAISVFDLDNGIGDINNQQTYQVVISTLAEWMAICILMAFLETWGRVPTQVMAYALGAFSSLSLAVWYAASFTDNTSPVLVVLGVLARMMVFGGGATTWVSTAEILSTDIRATGHALAAGMVGRLGGMASALTIVELDQVETLGLIVFGACFWISLASADIPETLRQDMGLAYVNLGHSERSFSFLSRSPLVRANNQQPISNNPSAPNPNIFTTV